MTEILDDDDIAPHDFWDAGELECGQLLLPLRDRVAALPDDGVLKLTTRAPAASLDVRAWCRLTGHRMLKAAPPDFYIQRNGRGGP
jgi:tRNA 2-thiouridine synthesizing protein A